MINKTTQPGTVIHFQQPGLIKAAAIFQSVYASIEITDCVTVCAMALHLIDNPYPKILFS